MFLIENSIWDMCGWGESVSSVPWSLVLDTLPAAFYPKVVVTCCDATLQEKMQL